MCFLTCARVYARVCSCIYVYTYASIVGVQRRSKKEDEGKGHRHLASNLAGEETKWPTEEGTRRVGVRTEARSDFHSYSR